MDRQAELRQRIQKHIHRSITSQSPTDLVNSALRFWQDALLFLPIIYAVIYLIGMFYHIGYLSAFRLGPDEYPLATDLTMLQGGFSLISMSLSHLDYALAFFVIFFLLLTFLVFARRAREKLTIFFKKLKNTNSQKKQKETLAKAKVTTQLVDKSAALYARFTVLLIQLMLVIFLGVLSMKRGLSDAEKDQNDLYQQSTPKTQNISKLLIEPPYLRVVCNATHCAYWNKTGTIILRHDQVERTYLPSHETKKS